METNFSVLVTIVTFNPNINDFKINLSKILQQFKKILIIDNKSNNIDDIDKFIKRYGDRIILVKRKKNLGLANALNYSFSYASKFDYGWNLTMDQDSTISKNYHKGFDEFIKKNTKNIAIVSPYVFYDDYSNYNSKKIINNKILFDQFPITSGSFTNVNAFIKSGYFNEKLFIDQLDHDLCLRFYSKGYDLVTLTYIYIIHKLGETKCYNFMGIKICTTNHNSKRIYFIYRNFIYLAKKYHYLSKKSFIRRWFIRRKISLFFLRPIKILFLEKDKLNKFLNLFKGIFNSELYVEK
jgi:rhamnosyltransferase